MKTSDYRGPSRRRGVAIIIVLGMLTLFMAVGVTFVLFTRIESQGARNFKRAFQEPAGGRADVHDVDAIFRTALSQLIYDTDNKQSAIRGHSLLRDMFGSADSQPLNTFTGTVPNEAKDDGAELRYQPTSDRYRPYYGAYNGTGIFNPIDTDANGEISEAEVSTQLRNLKPYPEFGTALNTATWTPILPFNYSVFDLRGTRPATLQVTAGATSEDPTPEKFSDTANFHWFGFDEDYDYPDFNNMFLAMERADGRILIPSFHRPHLLTQLKNQGAFGGATDLAAWQTSLREGRQFIFRPRRIDYDANLIGGLTGITPGAQFPGMGVDTESNTAPAPTWSPATNAPDGVPDDVDRSGYVGDYPEELDVDTDGDGMKDAIWVDLGIPKSQWVKLADGTYAKPLFAFKVIAMDGKINLNTAGNYFDPTVAATAGITTGHVSNLGASPAEINPKHALILMPPIPPATTPPTTPPNWTASVQPTLPGGYHDLFTGSGITLGQGKWSKQTGGLVTDRAGMNDVTTPPPAATNDDNKNLDTEYSDGTTTSSAITSLLGPADYLGTGKYYEPFCDPAQDNATLPSTPYAGNRRQIMPLLANYANFNYNTWAATANNTPLTKTELAINEPYEFNPYQTTTDDNPITAAQIERLLRFTDIDSSGMDNRIADILTANLGTETLPPVDGWGAAFKNRDYIRNRLRRLFTHASWDIINYSTPPAYVDSTSTPLSGFGNALSEDYGKYFLDPKAIRKHNGTLTMFASAAANPPLDKYKKPSAYTVMEAQFGATTHGNGERLPLEVKAGRRYDLNRPLVAYTLANHLLADRQRTDMAEQIYVLLWMATHPAFSATADDNARARTLAQLAVNIVDFIDPDDVMTRLAFDPNLNDGTWDLPTQPWENVYGFELPNVVINEAVSLFFPYELDNGMTPKNVDKVWVWAELANPWPGNTTPVRLYDTTTNPGFPRTYVLGIRCSGMTTANVDDFDTGSWDQQYVDFSSSDDYASGGTIQIAGQDFLLVGPPGTLGNADGSAPAKNEEPQTDLLTGWNQTPAPGVGNHFTAGAAADAGNVSAGVKWNTEMKFDREPQDTANRDIEITLYRLRNPWGTKTAMDYVINPYIAIDSIKLTNNVGSYGIGEVPTAATPVADRISRERRQPWQGYNRPWFPTDGTVNNAEGRFLGFPDLTTGGATGSLGANRMKLDGFTNSSGANSNTLRIANAAVTAISMSFPFANRQLASPLELLSVRLYGSHFWGTPYEWRLRFTDDFEYDVATRVWRSRQTPWFAENRAQHPLNTNNQLPLADLYRFFELVECRSRMTGSAVASNGDPAPFGWNKWDPAGATPYAVSGATTGSTDPNLTYEDLRRSRVDGKINPNAVVDEEVFKALLDTEEAMPPIGAFRPTNYPTDFTTPTVDTSRSIAWDSLTKAIAAAGELATDALDFGGGNTGAAVAPAGAARQWPGITSGGGPTAYPGSLSSEQVSGDLYRAFLLSKAGRDGIVGTGDDKPFRSYAANRVADTLLRRRNYRALDYPVANASDDTQDAVMTADTAYSMAPGEFIFSLGGQWTPRLFDPIANPFDLLSANNISTRLPISGLPGTVAIGGTDANIRADYWMLEYRRNRLLGKIANNVTPRSHVFGVWITVGLFRVQKGTESYTAPLLNEEINSSSGQNIRHRGFFIVDRSLSENYSGPLTTEPAIGEMTPVVYSRIIE